MTAVKRKPPLSVYDVKRRNRPVKLTSLSRIFNVMLHMCVAFSVDGMHILRDSLKHAYLFCNDMVPTDHDIPFSRTFQGLLRDIFKEFSRTFLCSFKHPFAKKDQKWTFQIRHTETIWYWIRQKNVFGGGGGGEGDLGMCFLTFLDDLLYYGYNTGSNNSAWKWGLGKILACNYVTIRVETVNFETDWCIETHNIHKYL